MTESTPPDFPANDDSRRPPSAWSMCPRCGAATPAGEIHEQWHQAIEARVEQARQRLVAFRDATTAQIADLDQRVDALEVQVAALLNPI